MGDNIAIIGTAGRGTDARRINRNLYDAMYREVCSAIDDWQVFSAVSGGAAVADHLAVRAFLEGKVSNLTLYLPARFEKCAYVPNPAIRFNPGQTANNYHRAFSASCDIDSLAEIDAAIRQGAKAVVIEGFKKRNLEVAATCSHMLALTFGGVALDCDDAHSWKDFSPSDDGFTNSITAGLKDGGTAHTWGEAWRPKLKRHVNLNRLARNLVTERETKMTRFF